MNVIIDFLLHKYVGRVFPIVPTGFNLVNYGLNLGKLFLNLCGIPQGSYSVSDYCIGVHTCYTRNLCDLFLTSSLIFMSL